MSQSESNFLKENLTDAQDYRSFINKLYLDRKSDEPSYSYAKLSQDMGFASRNTARETLKGHRRITLRGLSQLIQSFELKGNKEKLLSTLVYLEEPDLDPARRSKEALQLECERIRKKIKSNKNSTDGDAKSLYRHIHWPQVYAALGGDNGATAKEIKARTGLSTTQIESNLEALCIQNLAHRLKKDEFESTEQRFVANAETLHFGKLGTSLFFQKHYQSALRHALRKSEERFEESNQLFQSVCFSVDKEKMRELSQELKELIIRFASENEDSNGDQVVRIALSLTD